MPKPTPARAAGPDDLPEVSTLPAGAQDLIEPAPGPWRRVEAPVSVTDTAPVQDAGLSDPPPQIPLLVKIFGVAATAALVLVAAWLGLSAGGSSQPAEPTGPTDRNWALEPPQVVDGFVRGQTTETEKLTDDGPAVVRAEYSDGSRRITLLLSRPERDRNAYFGNAGISDPVTINGSMCGKQEDTGVPVCATIADDTGIMLVGLSEESTATLVRELEAFQRILAGN